MIASLGIQHEIGLKTAILPLLGLVSVVYMVIVG